MINYFAVMARAGATGENKFRTRTAVSVNVRFGEAEGKRTFGLLIAN